MVVINETSGGHCDEFDRRGSHLSSVNDHRVALSSADPTTNEAKNNGVVVDTAKVDLISQKNNFNSTYADNNETDNVEQKNILKLSFEIDKAEQREVLMADTESDNVNGKNGSIYSTEIDNFDQISCDAPFESRNGYEGDHIENNGDFRSDLAMDSEICWSNQETIENSNKGKSLDMETTHSFDFMKSKGKGKGNKRRKRAPWKSDNRRQKNSKGRPTRAEMPYEELLKLREKERIAQQLRRQRLRRCEGRIHLGSKSKGKKVVAKKTFLPQNGRELPEVESETGKIERPPENGKRVLSAKIFMPVDNDSVPLDSQQKIHTEENFSNNQRYSDETTTSSSKSFKKSDEITPSGPQSVERTKTCTVKTKLFVPEEIAENPKTDFMQALGLQHSMDSMNVIGMPENSMIMKQLVEQHGLYDDSVSSKKNLGVEARCWVPENLAASHFEEHFTQKYLDDNGGDKSDHSWSEASSDSLDRLTDTRDRAPGRVRNIRRSTLPIDELEKLREKERLAKRKQRSKCRKDFGSISTTADLSEKGGTCSNENWNGKQEKKGPCYATKDNELREDESTGKKPEDLPNGGGEDSKPEQSDIQADQIKTCNNDKVEGGQIRMKSNDTKKKTFGRLYDRSMLGPEELESLRRREREYQRKRRARLKEEKFKSLGDVLRDETKETSPTKVAKESAKGSRMNSLDDSHRKYETRMSKGISRPSLRFLEHSSISYFESENFDPTLERDVKLEQVLNGHPSRYGTDDETLEQSPKFDREPNGHPTRCNIDGPTLERGLKVERDCNGHPSRYDTNDPVPCQNAVSGNEDVKPRMSYASSDLSSYGYHHDNGYVEEFRSWKETETFRDSYRRQPFGTKNYEDTNGTKPERECIEDVYNKEFSMARSKLVEGTGNNIVGETTNRRSIEGTENARSSPVFGFMSEKKISVSDMHKERANEHIEHPLASRSHDGGGLPSRSPEKRSPHSTSPNSKSPHLKSPDSTSPHSISPYSRGPHSSSPHNASSHTNYNVLPSFVDRKSPLIDALYASDYKILQANGFKLSKNEDVIGPHCYDIPSDKRMFSTKWLDKYSPSFGSDSYGKFHGRGFYSEGSNRYNCQSDLQEPDTEKKGKAEVGDDNATSRWRSWKSGLTDMQLQRRRQSNREAQRRRRLRLRLMQMKSLEPDQIPVEDVMYKRYKPNNREMVTEAIKSLNLPRTKLKTMLEKKQEIFMNAQIEKCRNETESHVLAGTQPPNSAKARGCRVKVTPKRQVVVPSMGYALHAENRMAHNYHMFSSEACSQYRDRSTPDQIVHPREDSPADNDYHQHQNDQEHQDQLAMEEDSLQNTSSRKRKQFCPRRLLSEPERRSQDGLPSVVVAQ